MNATPAKDVLGLVGHAIDANSHNPDPESVGATYNLLVAIQQRATTDREVYDAMREALEGILRSAGYTSGKAEPGLDELSVGRTYLDAARATLALTDRKDGEG